MRKIKAGRAWLVIEEHFHTREKRLVSILPPRKTGKYVRDYVEQVYVDKFASIAEKICYKKNRKKSPFVIEDGSISTTIITCGHEPLYKAYYCHELDTKDDILLYKYNVYRYVDDNKIVEEMNGSISLV